MNTPLIIFPIALFFFAILALLSGIGVIMRQRNQRGGFFTTFLWSVFSGSISMGFAIFASFTYLTQDNLILAIGIMILGVVLIIGAGWLASR